MKVIDVARICHEANKALCILHGDHSQPKWDQAPKEIKDSAINGVNYHLNNPDATPENSHENWLIEKEENGWVYGEVKNMETKEDPCFVPYEELPENQKAKDHLFRNIIHALAPFIEDFEPEVKHVNDFQLFQVSLDDIEKED